MLPTLARRFAARGAERTPLIKFLGKRSTPHHTDRSPQPHPASPSGSLPQDFASSHASFSSYRDHAQQHGPLRNAHASARSSSAGSRSGSQLGAVVPPTGVFFDRSELPARFHRRPLDPAEMEAIESGGASLFA